MEPLWFVGVAIYIGGTMGESLGANLQRGSLMREQLKAEEDPLYEMPSKLDQPMWLTGFIVFVLAGISKSLALFFASQTMLAPLQLFLFLFNAIFANVLNQEPFNWFGLDGLATFLVMTGVVMGVWGAPKVNHQYSDEQMIELMSHSSFISFSSVASFFIIALYSAKYFILSYCDGHPQNIPQEKGYLRTILNMSYGSLAGAFGGVNVTLTKTVFALMVGQYQEDGLRGVIYSPLCYIVTSILISTYILQVIVTVNGLEVASAIIVISAQAVTEEVVVTLGGILYFEDYMYFTVVGWGIFMAGTFLAIASVIFLSHLRLHAGDEKALDGEESTPLFTRRINAATDSLSPTNSLSPRNGPNGLFPMNGHSAGELP
mmetsp:Transcript_15112/g.22070  ORF Transcript_15112/g.22070 Transcript_15112/m.22070 type:complete len:374 (+) Transcript_15112:153-1274(+)